jgi:cell division septation protein DedD
MGDLESYADAADRTVTVPGIDPLAATRDRLAGRLEEARQASTRILSTVEDPSARLMAAWNLFETARAEGAQADLALAARRLDELFPGSPEAALARTVVSGKGSRVTEAASPSQFLSAAGAATPPQPGPAPAPTTPDAKTYSVQAGAFQVKENADELVKDLSRAGFAATVREVAVQGRTVYRVYAATGLDRESAARLLERLRAAGYAGIITD